MTQETHTPPPKEEPEDIHGALRESLRNAKNSLDESLREYTDPDLSLERRLREQAESLNGSFQRLIQRADNFSSEYYMIAFRAQQQFRQTVLTINAVKDANAAKRKENWGKKITRDEQTEGL